MPDSKKVKKVPNGVAWRPVSHGVSPKEIFKLLKVNKNN